MSTAIGVINPTFRNVGRGQLGTPLSELLNYTPPNLATNYFTSQNTRPATNTGYQTPTYQPSSQTFSQPSSGTSLRLNNVFDSSVGLASQLISAFGRNPNQQITGSNSVQALVAPQQTAGYGTAGQKTAEQAAFAEQQRLAALRGTDGAGKKAVETATSFLDGIAESFGISTTTLAIGGAIGAYLLFKQPPKRR